MKDIVYFIYMCLFNQITLIVYAGLIIALVPKMRKETNNNNVTFISKLKPDLIAVGLFILNIMVYNFIYDLFDGFEGLVIMWPYIILILFFIVDIISAIVYKIKKSKHSYNQYQANIAEPKYNQYQANVAEPENNQCQANVPEPKNDDNKIVAKISIIFLIGYVLMGYMLSKANMSLIENKEIEEPKVEEQEQIKTEEDKLTEFEQQLKDETEGRIPPKVEEKPEEPKLTDRELAMKLYDKVTTDGDTGTYNTFDWIYQDKGKKDFIVSSATAEEKMLVLSNTLYEKTKLGCDTLERQNVPTKLDENFIACIGDESADFYTGKSVEKMYKELYGKNSVIDKSAIMLSTKNHNKLVYNDKYDGYVEYKNKIVEQPESNIEEGYFREIENYEVKDDSITIYEKVVLVIHNKIENTYTKPVDYQRAVYTFKKEDNNYIYVSRINLTK